MKETEILRGLSKARATFADGFVPTKRPAPSMGDRMLGRITGGAYGYKSPATNMPVAAPATAPAPRVVAPAPVEQAPIAVQAVTQNSGGLGMAARGLMDHNKRLQERTAAGFAGGYVETELEDGSFLDEYNRIKGEGTGTSDSIKANVSNNEAILPAKTVRAVGPKNIARLIEETNGVKPKRGLRDAGTIGGDNEYSASTKNGVTSGKIGYADGFVGETVDKFKRGFGAIKNTFSGGAGTPPPINSAAAPAPVGATPNVIAKTPTQSVTGVGQDAGLASSRTTGNVASTALPAKPPGIISKGLKFAGKAATPLVAIGSAAESYGTPTSEYQKRTGIQNELGARAAGVFQDLGDNLLLGYGNELGNAIAGNGFVDPSNKPAAPTTAAAPATIDNETGVIEDTAVQPPSAPAAPTGLAAAQQAAPVAGPYDEARELIKEAAYQDSQGTLKGQVKSANLRRQAEALQKSVDDEQTQITTRAGQKTNQGLTDQLKLSENALKERAADEKSANEFQKRIAELYPDTGSGKEKIDNSTQRAELTGLMATTLDKLPANEQAALFNSASGQRRGVEGLDSKARQRLVNNYKTRQRVMEATQGIAGIGNQAGELSDNLMDYDLEKATRVGDMITFPNGAGSINISDLEFAEGPANPFVPNAIESMFKTPTSRYKTNLRQGARGK